MMAFGTALAGCRKIVESEADDGWKAFTLATIDNWIDLRFETEWEAIEKAATSGGRKPLSPYPLIEWVIDEAIKQKKVRDRFVSKTTRRGKKFVKIVESKLLEDQALSSAEKDWRAARDPKRWDLNESAVAKRHFAQKLRTDRQRILGRKPNPERLFIAACRQMFIDTCGQPLDDVTKVLTNVVTGKEVKVKEFRSALKPTTKAARDIRRQK
jgi:hypothetical protein